MKKFGMSEVGWDIYMDILLRCGVVELLQCLFDL